MANYSNFDLRKFISEGKKTKEENIDEAGPGFAHDCAAHVVHETYGYGVCIEGRHTLVENKETGKHEVTHYDVFFKSGDTVKNIPVNELDIKSLEEHSHGKRKKNEDAIEEEEVQEGFLGRILDKLFGLDKFNACMEAGWDSSDECKKIKDKISYEAGVKSGFQKSSGTTNVAEESDKLTKEETFKNEIKDILDS